MSSDLDAEMLATLMDFLRQDVPHQFVPEFLLGPVAAACARLTLPEPVQFAGNLVIGDLATSSFILSAHLDEASFSVRELRDSTAALSAVHRMDEATGIADLTFVGFRAGRGCLVGEGVVDTTAKDLACAVRGDVRVGDRAVYKQRISVHGNLLSAKAIDDRLGTVIALYAADLLSRQDIPVAIVLSDGEQSRPDGYFSRTFPQVLQVIPATSTVVFVDGIFQRGLEREGLDGPCREALVVPHSGDGAGYSVPPRLFSLLRDDIVPKARQSGIDVRVSSAYHSRGDDWGMVTNPTSGAERDAFFVSFGGWGATPAMRTIDTGVIRHCTRFLVFAVSELTRHRAGRESS